MNDESIKKWTRKLIELEDKVARLRIEIEKKQSTKLAKPLKAAELEEEISYLKDWIEFYSKEIKKYKTKINGIRNKGHVEEKTQEAEESVSEFPQTQKNIEESFNFIFKDAEWKPKAESNVPVVKEKTQTVKKIMSHIKENSVAAFQSQPSWIKYVVPCIILILLITSLFSLKPALTGHVVLSKENIFSENLNLKINESGTYEWKVKNPGDIKSIKVSGSVIGGGTVKVYIEKNGTKYLLYKDK